MIRIKQMANLLFLAGLIFLGFYFTKGPSYPNSFEVTDQTQKILNNKKQDYSGATLVNLDNDPELEIFVSGYGTHNLLLKRVKNEFHPMSIPELIDENGYTFSVLACDLDQDGRDEILFLNRPDPVKNKSHSRIVKYMNGKWMDILNKDDPIVETLKFGYSSTCIDRKGNGKYGIAISKENGKLSYLEWINLKITDIADQIGLDYYSKGRSILGIPSVFGKMNIFVGNEDGANFYFVNNGEGQFTEKAHEVGLSDPKFNARGISIIDLNHDEIPDIVYGNHYGPIRLLEQSREGKFIDRTPESIINSYAVNSPVVGDFNLDGYEDIYLNNIRGANKLFSRFKNEWYKVEVGVLAEEDMFGVSTIAGDLDQNGSYEILNTHGDGSHFPLSLYSIKPTHQWIKFSIKYQSGAIPRGAIIRLMTTKRDHLRVISSGSGRFANYGSDLLLGLQNGEKVLLVKVILPSGKRIEFKDSFKIADTNHLIVLENIKTN